MKKIFLLMSLLSLLFFVACEEGKKTEQSGAKVVFAVQPMGDEATSRAKYEPFAKLLAEQSGLDIELRIPANMDELVTIATEGKADIFILDAPTWLKVAKQVKPVWTMEDESGSKESIPGQVIFHRETAKKLGNWVDKYVTDWYNKGKPVKCMVQDRKDISYLSCVLRLKRDMKIDPEVYLNLIDQADANKIAEEIMKEPPKDAKDYYPIDMAIIKKGSINLNDAKIKEKLYELYPGLPIPNLTIGVRSGLDQAIMGKINDALLNKIDMGNPVLKALGGTRFRSANPDTYANINLTE